MKKNLHDAAEPPAVSADVRAYAAQMLAARMERMLAEAKQARRGKRTEPIHQMRVWSRRSRAALEMFAPCFFGRRYAGVAQSVHDVTGALGAARDLDVMILTLRERANALPDEQRAGLFAFVKVLRARRKAAQRPVVRAVKELAKSKTAKFAKTLTEHSPPIPRRKKSGKTSGGVNLNAALVENAARLITKRLDALYEYNACLDDAGAVTQHHAMRIAAKKLRYTMDIFQEAVTANLPDAAPFVSALEAVKALQEHLGEMHDADVLAPQLAGYMAQMLKDGYAVGPKEMPKAGVHCVSFDACEGILTLCRETAVRRDERFAALRSEWTEFTSNGVFDGLKMALETAQHPAPLEAALTAVAPIEMEWPETPTLEIVHGVEMPGPAALPAEENSEEIEEKENSHEETRIEPVAADGGRPASRTARVARARRAPAEDAGGHSEPGADSPESAAKSGLPRPARTKRGAA